MFFEEQLALLTYDEQFDLFIQWILLLIHTCLPCVVQVSRQIVLIHFRTFELPYYFSRVLKQIRNPRVGIHHPSSIIIQIMAVYPFWFIIMEEHNLSFSLQIRYICKAILTFGFSLPESVGYIHNNYNSSSLQKITLYEKFIKVYIVYTMQGKYYIIYSLMLLKSLEWMLYLKSPSLMNFSYILSSNLMSVGVRLL